MLKKVFLAAAPKGECAGFLFGGGGVQGRIFQDVPSFFLAKSSDLGWSNLFFCVNLYGKFIPSVKNAIERKNCAAIKKEPIFLAASGFPQKL